MGTATKGSTDFVNRFWSKVREEHFGCWVWTGGKANGYGTFHCRGTKKQAAHRLSWELHHGIPSPNRSKGYGIELDHLCRNRACVNPAHLEVVTLRTNVLRGISPAAQFAKQTECKNGHPFNSVNTLFRTNQPARVCRICHRENKKKRQHVLLRAGLTRDGLPRKKRLRSNVRILSE